MLPVLGGLGRGKAGFRAWGLPCRITERDQYPYYNVVCNFMGLRGSTAGAGTLEIPFPNGSLYMEHTIYDTPTPYSKYEGR